ncbi:MULTISPECIES: carbohydrate ABC transporter permease [Microbacterium]|uniref:carbohydrate ABC transporter permease n=1 Tax=Microbacterium TaxID=33882 RepID=UPI001B7D26CC|nr:MULTISPECIES: carbohydrate ABC transporter permease [Microbacterium]
MVAINSFKDRDALFAHPFALPIGEAFSLGGYERVFDDGHFGAAYLNSAVVTVASTFLVVILGAMLSFALTEYAFRGRLIVSAILGAGLILSVRLGTVGLIEVMSTLGLMNTVLALILVYTASSLPIAVLVLSPFMRSVPAEIKEAGRVDGAGEFTIFRLVLPSIRPALATVAVFVMIPIWNDLWFPLILAPSTQTQTVTLATQQFLGQFQSDWPAVLAALTLAAAGPLLLYIIFSRQLISGLTSGVTK